VKFTVRCPLRPQTVAEGAEGIQEFVDELFQVVVTYFLTHGHKHRLRVPPGSLQQHRELVQRVLRSAPQPLQGGEGIGATSQTELALEVVDAEVALVPFPL
jgi:hypothetical protein